jgi:hypothetical protein
MNRPTKMRLPYGDSVDLLGGTRITVLKSADRHPDFFTLRLHRIEGMDEQEMESAAPEPVQEDPLQTADGETLPGQGGVGTAGPLPDSGPKQVEMVEGVGGEAEAEFERIVGAYAPDLQAFESGRRVGAEEERRRHDDLLDALPLIEAALSGKGEVVTKREVIANTPFSVGVKWTATLGRFSGTGRTEEEALRVLELKLRIMREAAAG